MENLRTYKVEVTYTVKETVDIKAVNAAEAMEAASKMATNREMHWNEDGFKNLGTPLFDSCDIADVDETNFSEAGFKNHIADEFLRRNPGYDRDEVMGAVEDLVSDMEYFDELSDDEIEQDLAVIINSNNQSCNM